MEELYIICVEDQREVINAITEQLSSFENYLIIEECESAQEAITLMSEIDSQGGYVAVVISDHVMPGMTGVELLTQIKEDMRFSSTKKILLTGQATHSDTIEAINQAKIDKYIEKPWESEDLVRKVSKLLTEYIIETGIDHRPYLDVLDKLTLFDLLKQR